MDFKTKTRAGRESGVTLIETMIAAVILLVGVIAIMRLMAVAVGQNLSQGDVQTRVSEYCEDKMEQLMALSFSDVSSNTTVFPPTTTGGVGLTPGGSLSLASPVANYCDYLDISGNLLTSSAGAYYERVWSISNNASANLKTISVTVGITDATVVASPTTTLVCLKTNVP
jgi:Tfp pilus assembly protein PilV